MKKLLYILTVLILGFSTQSSAQEEAVFNHYHINPLLTNPGAAGFDKDEHNVFFNLRNQWSGFEGTPKTYSFSYNGPIGERLGIGALIYTENIAAITRFRAQLAYAFNYSLKEFDFGVGMSTEFHRLRITNDATDNPLYQAGDVQIEDAIEGLRVFDASLGIRGTYKDDTYFGLTFPNLIRNKLDEIAFEERSFFISYYIATLGHRFNIEEQSISFDPSVMVRRVRNVPLTVDFNLKVGFMNDRLMTGVTYRAGTGGAMSILLGTKYNTLAFYYSYDIYFQRFQRYNGGSHELTLAFVFEKKDKVEKKR